MNASTPASTDTNPAIRVEGVARHYGAVRDVDGHPHFVHALDDPQAEHRQAAIALFQEAAADAIVEVVGELRDPLA